MLVIDGSKIEGTLIPEPFKRVVKVFMAPDTQDHCKDISVTQGIFYPHSMNDLHTHEGFEIIYIISGYGKCVIGDETYDIKPDTLVICPPGVPHRQINESDETLKQLAIWTPALKGSEVVTRAVETAK